MQLVNNLALKDEPTSASGQVLTGSEAVFAILRYSSLQEGRSQLRDETMTIAETAPTLTGVVREHWMAVILLAGQKLKLTLKVFYRSDFCRGLLEVLAKDAAIDVRRHLNRDIMREYCNRTGGSAKRIYADCGAVLGLSLPLVTRGFDEIFNEQIENKGILKDTWTLQSACGQAYCVAELGTSDRKELQELTWTAPEPSANAGEEGELEML